MILKVDRQEHKNLSEAWKHYCSNHDDIIDYLFAGQITGNT